MHRHTLEKCSYCSLFLFNFIDKNQSVDLLENGGSKKTADISNYLCNQDKEAMDKVSSILQGSSQMYTLLTVKASMAGS